MAINLGSLGDLKIDLSTSAHKLRKELVKMPIIGLGKTLENMTLVPGVRFAETVGELSGNLQFGPYSESYKDNGNVAIKPRTLQTYFGSVIKDFSPNSVAKTLWGQSVTKGQELKNADIIAMILPYLMKKLGGNLNASVWSATRNADGHTTADLFNGFDTITTAEITAATTIYNAAVTALLTENADATDAQQAAAGNAAVVAAGSGINVNLGNYQDLSSAGITTSNAVDVLRAFVQAAAPELQGLELEGDNAPKLYCSYDVYNKYNEAYQSVVGPVVYNTGYTKRFIEGTNVELVPLVNKSGSNYIHLSTKGNMLIGVNQVGEEETVAVDMFSSFVLTLSATLFFGVQFESISKEVLCVGKIA